MRAAVEERVGSQYIKKKDTTMKRTFLTSAVIAGVLAVNTTAMRAAVNVVTTTEDLGSIVKEVGGDKVTVESLAHGYQDPHFVEAKPSFILKLNRADLLVVVGRELEIGWLPPLITQSRNAEDSARRPRLSRRVADGRRSSTSRPGRSPGRWATSIRRGIRTTGSIPTTAGASRRRFRRS